MGCNLAQVTQAASKLLANPGAVTALSSNGVCLPMVTQKAAWQVQATGIYDLIFANGLHKDFPTRKEVALAITMSFSKHLGSAGHLGASPVIADDPMEIMQETTIVKMSKGYTPPIMNPLGDVDMPEMATQPTTMMVRATSPLTAIGYGV